MIGKSLREAEFRSRYKLHVIGLRRKQQSVADFEDVKLARSDSLFVAGSWSSIQKLKSRSHDFVVLELPAEHADIVPSYRRMPAALNKTGGTQFIVDALMSAVGESSPYVMLSLIFFLTASLSLVLSNTASAVLVAPIAIYAAGAIGVSPYPFAVAVLIAASAAYSTPVSTPVVTLVVEPGRYKFTDFVKVGVPLLFLTYLVILLIAPLIFPFSAS